MNSVTQARLLATCTLLARRMSCTQLARTDAVGHMTFRRRGSTMSPKNDSIVDDRTASVT